MINYAAFPAVEITLYTLGAFSVATWSLILAKSFQHSRSARRNKQYAQAFWSAPNLQAAAEIEEQDSALGHLSATVLKTLEGGRAGATGDDLEHSWDVHEQLERNLKQQIQREKRALDSGLAVLASIGSTAPFVGLFGTVWGIMTAMTSIAKLGNASIDVVAGPIGEALIATAIGIGVALPAVLAYNYFVRRVKSATADFDEFANDLLNLAQRALYRVEPPVRPVEVRHDPRHESRSDRHRDADLHAVAVAK